MQPDPHRYRTLVFDCDGVLLDSNRVKTDAFFSAAVGYGEVAALSLVDYHKRNGGISRFRKFEYFLTEIVGVGVDDIELRELLDAFSREVRGGMLSCPVSPALPVLRRVYPETRFMVVSGGDQSELREIFLARGIDAIFDGGIFGSPETKEAILERELAAGHILLPALFIGDSRYDHEAASRFGIDFLFVSSWSEFSEWRAYQARHGFPAVADLAAWLAVV